MQFFAMHYSLVFEQEPLTLFPEKITKHEIPRLFEGSFNRGVTIKYYAKNYRIFKLGSGGIDHIELGYLLKSSKKDLTMIEDEVLKEAEFKGWEKILYLLDKTRQIIIFEHKTSVCTPENIRHIVKKLCQGDVAQVGYRLDLNYIVDEKGFWNVIEQSELIYEIGFELEAPNFFGASIEAHKLVERLKEVFNNTSSLFQVKNESGHLVADRKEIDDYRKLADSGGGSWYIRAKLKNRKNAWRYSSQGNLRKEKLSGLNPSSSYITRNIEEVISRLKNVIDRFRSLL